MSVEVGGILGSIPIIKVGDTTYVKISFFNNAGFDWNLKHNGISYAGQISSNDASLLLKDVRLSIQTPLEYKFLSLQIPSEMNNFITVTPSDHFSSIDPSLFDFDTNNPVSIKDGNRADYYFKVTLSNGFPAKYYGKVLSIEVTLEEAYFDALPGYNDPLINSENRHLKIPNIKIGIPYITGTYSGKVFETSGYSTNISLSMNIPTYIQNMEYKIIREEAIPNLKSASADKTNYANLINNVWNELEPSSYSFTKTLNANYNIVLVPTVISTFPLKNDLMPDNATFYILFKGYIPKIERGINIVISGPAVLY